MTFESPASNLVSGDTSIRRDIFVNERSESPPSDNASITGRATSGSTGLAGVVVRVSNGFSVTTNASGYYTLTNLIAGTYILTPTLSGYSFSPPTRTVNLSGNQTGQDFNGAQGGPPQQKVYLPIVLK